VPTRLPTKNVRLQGPSKLPQQLRQHGPPHPDPPPIHLQHKNSAFGDRKSQLNMRWPMRQASLPDFCGSQCLGGPSWPDRERLSVDPLDESSSNGRFRSFCLNKLITESYGSLFRDFNFSDLCRKHLAMPWPASLVVTVMPYRDANGCAGHPIYPLVNIRSMNSSSQ
jgi:hypothetical protein